MPTFNSSKHLIEGFQRYLPTEEPVGVISNMYSKDYKVKQLLGNIFTENCPQCTCVIYDYYTILVRPVMGLRPVHPNDCWDRHQDTP